MVKKIIETTIREHHLIHEGEHVVMGLSGGPDSVCLFFVLKELSEEMNFRLHAVHVNHSFRPGAAEKDQLYVEELCRQAQVPCRTFVYDCNALAREKGLTSEEAGRQARYEAFYKTAEELQVPKEKIKIAVAQNANDQAETVLFRLMRGSGTDGLAGMEYSRMEKDICVIRPLLDTWRKDIEDYCREKKLKPRIDRTNLEPVYTRNKIRLQLIPYLEENFNPNIMEAMNRLSCIAGEDREFLWQSAEETYEKLKEAEGVLPQQELAQLPKAIRHRVMLKALKTQGLTQDVAYTHLEAADRILEKTGESRIAEFPEGYQMVVRYGQAVFCKKHQETENFRLIASITAEEIQGDVVFDYDKIAAVHGENFRVELRTRRAGDYLPLKKGRKKLQNFLVDEKVPREVRDQVQFAAVGSEILWIMPQPQLGISRGRCSQQYKLDDTTKKRLTLELVCDI